MAVAASLATTLVLSGCAGAGSFGGDGDGKTITVAIVSNSQMSDAISLAPEFEAENPG
ncbi:MAG: sugar ABC transporter substrate-binding protein, partial [Rhodococcus sp.]|nr:sugar ABC transporter substrate-binding protein [Rhodococcus sp. (in: high G+C Gram-positive bacteria)]